MRYEACEDCGVEKTKKQRVSPRCGSCAQKIVPSNFKGRTQSLDARRKMSLSKGGNGILEHRHYPGLKRWAESVKKTFPCCVICRSTVALEAHHIIPKVKYPQYATLTFNGVTLCKPCHKEIHAAS